MNISSEKKAESVYHKKDIYQRESVSNLKDFFLPLVEFFGILVPGVFFLIALIPSVVIPFVLFFKTTTVYIKSIIGCRHDHLLNIIDFYWILISKTFVLADGWLYKSYGFFFLIFSYVIGNVLFNQDVSVADYASFNKTSRRYKEVGPVRRREEDNEQSYKAAARFPYRDLGIYLKHKGLGYLEERIPWKGEGYVNKNYNFLNNLKLHIEFTFPREYIRIQRNEAHVKLMTSTWYALTWIIKLSLSVYFLVYFILLLSIYKFSILKIALIELTIIPYFLLFPLSMLITAYFLRRLTENVLHHQRVREIICILEIACFADTLCPDMNIFGYNTARDEKMDDSDENKGYHNNDNN